MNVENNSISKTTLNFNEQWISKPQPYPKEQKEKPIYRNQIHKRNGKYWFGNKPVKYLIEQARKDGLIVAPPDHI